MLRNSRIFRIFWNGIKSSRYFEVLKLFDVFPSYSKHLEQFTLFRNIKKCEKSDSIVPKLDTIYSPEHGFRYTWKMLKWMYSLFPLKHIELKVEVICKNNLDTKQLEISHKCCNLSILSRLGILYKSFSTLIRSNETIDFTTQCSVTHERKFWINAGNLLVSSGVN